MQHFSDVLTKENPDWEYFTQFMRTNLVHLNQDPAAVAIKEKKRAGRAARKTTVSEDDGKKALKEKAKDARRKLVASQITEAQLDEIGEAWLRGSVLQPTTF